MNEEKYTIEVSTEEMIEILKSRLREDKDEKNFVRKYLLNKYALFDLRTAIIRSIIKALIEGGIIVMLVNKYVN